MKTFSDVFQFIWDNDYLRFLLIAVLSLIVAFLIKLIVAKILKPLAHKTKTKIDDLVVKSISSIIFYFIGVFYWFGKGNNKTNQNNIRGKRKKC